MESLRGLLEDLESPAADVGYVQQRLRSLDELLQSPQTLPPAELSLAVYLLPAKLIPLARKKENVDVVVSAAKILAEFPSFTSLETAVELKNAARGLVTSSSSAKAKIAGLELLLSVFKRWPGSENASQLEVGQCERMLHGVIVQSSKNSPTVLRGANCCLGALCRAYPDETRNHKDTNFNYFMGQMDAQMSSKVRTPDLPIIEGCLIALDDYLHAFGIEEDDPEKKEKVYTTLQKLCPKPDEGRTKTMRCAIELFCNHCSLFSDFIVNDVKYWYHTIMTYAFSKNRDDHKVGWRAILAFFKSAGEQLGEKSNETAFNFLLCKFVDILSNAKSSAKETSLAIQGYGHLAKAARRDRSEADVALMLLTLMQRTEEIFFGSEEDNSFGGDKNLHLSSYIEALNSIIRCCTTLPPSCILTFERLLVHMIAIFPRLPVQYYPFCLRAVNEGLFIFLEKDLNRDVVSNVVYQGIIQSCSYPIITLAEGQLLISESLDNVVSVVSFLPFWNGLLRTAANSTLETPLYDAIIESVTNILEKLNFSTMSESIDDEKAVDSEATLESSPKACKAKDFTVMANLVTFCQSFLASSRPSLFRKWVNPVGSSLVSLATKYPEVSGFYRLISASFATADKLNYFSELDSNDSTFRSFALFLERILRKSASFEKELLLACNEMCVAVPTALAKNIIDALRRPLERIFTSGNRNLGLIDKAVGFLQRVKLEVEAEVFAELIKNMLPSMRTFLQVSRRNVFTDADDDENEAAPIKSSDSRRRRRRKREIKEDAVTECEIKVQRKLLIFLGMECLSQLLPSKEELGRRIAVFDINRSLDFDIPFQDLSAKIALDDFLPRVLQLSQDASDRKCRIAAGEVLHAMVLFIIGRSSNRSSDQQQENPLTAYYDKIFPVMIRLSGDSDLVLRELFSPLMLQAIHWFTRNLPYEASEATCVLDSIMDGICADDDAALRTRCAAYLNEFLTWSIKQTPPDKMATMAFNPTSVFNRLNTMWLHPDPIRRFGASLAFNNCYRKFREEAPLVSRFALEIAVNLLKSLGMACKDQVDYGAIEETKKSVDHIIRILKQKSATFEKEDPYRKVMERKEGSTLKDFVAWLFGVTLSQEAELRHKAVNFLFELTSTSTRQSAFQKHLKTTGCTEIKFLQSLDWKTDFDLEDWCSGAIDGLILATETCTWLIGCNVTSDKFHFDSLNLVTESLPLFIKFMVQQKPRPKVTCEAFSEMADLQRKRSELIVRLVDFVLACEAAAQVDVVIRLWNTDFWMLILLLVLSPAKLGFNTRDLDVCRELHKLEDQLLTTYRQKLSSKVKKPQQLVSMLPIEEASVQDLVDAALAGRRQDDETVNCLNGIARLISYDIIDLPLISDLPDKVMTATLAETSEGQQVLDAVFTFLVASFRDAATENLANMTSLYFGRTQSKILEKLLHQHSLRNPGPILSKVFAQFDPNTERVVMYLIKLVKLFLIQPAENKSSPSVFLQPFTTNWGKIESFCNSGLDALLSTMILVKTLVLISPVEMHMSLPWFCGILTRKDLKLQVKNKLLDVLPAFLTEGCAQSTREAVKTSLEDMANINYPLSCTELKGNTSLYRDYVESFEKLFISLKVSACPLLLTHLTILVCREAEEHVCMQQWTDCLASLLARRPKEVQLTVITAVHSLFANDARCGDTMKLKILNDALIPLLSGASSLALNSFYVDVVSDILNSLELGLSGSEQKRMGDLVRKIAACKLVSVMYSKLSKQMVHSSSADISKTFFAVLKSRGIAREKAEPGTEMGRFLLLRLVQVRAEVIDASTSSQLQELYRLYQCSAYNAVMSVITCLQDAEKFYSNYIFSEKVSKSELIFSRIISSTKKYSFPLEVDSFSRKRRQIVTIRRSKHAESNRMSESGIQSHYLGDSSLSQDISMFSIFDYSQSMSSFNDTLTEPKVKDEPSIDATAELNQNVIYLENDDINNHECMATLLAVLDFMKDSKIYSAPETPDEAVVLPDWLKFLMDKLRDESCHKNVKLFILRLISNRPETFRPFASLLGVDVLRLIVCPQIWDSEGGMNSLQLDLIALLLSWSDYYDMEKTFSCMLFEQIIVACAEATHRELIKYLVELLRSIVEKWGKNGLNVPSRVIYNKLVGQNISSYAVIMIVGIFLEHSVSPVSESSGISTDKFWARVLDHLDSDQKQIRNQAAEVLGRALKFFEEKDPYIFKLLEEMTVAKLSRSGAGQARFVESLYHCHKHFPSIVTRFFKKFIYDLKQRTGPELTQCLEMLSAAVPAKLARSESGLQKELKMMDLGLYLDHYDRANQMASLDFLKNLVEHMEASLAMEYVPRLKMLSSHSSSQVRLKVVDVAKCCFSNFRRRESGGTLDEESVFRASLAILTKAIGDREGAVAKSAMNFFREEVLSKTVADRLSETMRLLLNTDSQDDFLSASCSLLLSLTDASPGLQRKLYSEPLNANFQFRTQNINCSWRSQTQLELVPRFVETLTTTQTMGTQAGRPGNNFGYLRATQTTLEFDPTQMSSSLGLSQADNSGGTMSGQVSSGGSINSPQSSQVKNEGYNNPRVGKRFIKAESVSHDQTRARFASLHAKKERKSARMAEDRRGRSMGQVKLTRDYRVGELPDIEISCADIVKPLSNLCARDEYTARLFFTLLCKQVSQSVDKDVTRKISDSISVAMRETHFFYNRTVAAAVMEILQHFEIDDLNLDKVVSISRSLQLESVGLCVLENTLKLDAPAAPAAKRKKVDNVTRGDVDEKKEVWMHMLQLYQSLDDKESVRGISVQNFPEMTEVMTFECENRWSAAVERYKEMMQGQHSQKTKQLLRGSYLNALQVLSNWECISDEITTTCRPLESIWNDEWQCEFLLPKLFQAETHNMLNKKSGCGGPLIDLVQKAIEMEDKSRFQDISRRFGLELTLMFVQQSKPDKAKAYFDKFMDKFLREEWSGMNSNDFAAQQVRTKLALLKRASLASRALCVNKDETAGSSLISECWLNSSFSTYASLQHLEDFLRDQSIYLQRLGLPDLEDEVTRLQAKGYLDLAEQANRRRQWEVATSALSMAKKSLGELGEDEAGKTRFEHLYADTAALKLLDLDDKSLGYRFNMLYHFIIEAEKKKGSPHYASTKTRLLSAAEELIATAADKSTSMADLLNCLTKENKKSHFQSLAADAESLSELREKFLREMIRTMSDHGQLDGSQWLQLSSYCYTLTHDFGERDALLVKTIIDSHLKAISAGNVRARQLFPNLMTLMTEEVAGGLEAEECARHFVEQVSQVESWLFMPWVNQLLSIVHSSKYGAQLLQPLVLRMAKQYPEALRFSYLLSKESKCDVNTSELDTVLTPTPLVNKLLDGLSHVSVPEVLLQDALFPSDPTAEDVVELAKKIKNQIEVGKNSYGPLFKKSVDKWLNRQRLSSQSELKKLKPLIKDYLGNAKRPKVEQLSQLVPFLQDFHSSNYAESFEIPGQYVGYQQPDPEKHVKLMFVQNKVKEFSSMRKPIALTMVGDDGKKYSFIVKCGEDLRQDERIQQVLAIANQSMTALDLQIITYKVVPLTTHVGLIECLRDTCTYGDLTKDSGKTGDQLLCQSKDDFLKFIKEKTEERARRFAELVKLNDGFTLKNNFLRLSTSPEGFFFFRDNYIRSHSLHSVVGWLVSLGDRHAGNFLVSLVTGESVAIDFGYSFGATAFLPIPELVPFRMTPQITNMALPFVKQGPMREIMVQALGCIRRDASVLMAALELFIKEPTMDWLKLAKMQANLKKTSDLTAEFPKLKVGMVRKKLDGGHPSLLALEELEHSFNNSEQAKKMSNQYKEVLLGPRDTLRRGLLKVQSPHLSVAQQVDCLLEASTDQSILRCAFRGWRPLA